MGQARRATGWLKRVGIAAALLGAGIAGYLFGGLIFAGRERLKERAPIALVRAFLGQKEGREADAPHEIPPRGWLEILRRTLLLVAKNRLMAESAAVTFFALLAFFPAMTFTVSIYGLFADPSDIQALVGAAADIVPRSGLEIIHGQLDQLIRNGPKGLTLGALVSLGAALWSSNQGSKALFESMNVIYREEEKRSYPYFVLVSMTFSLAAIIFVLVAIVGVIVLPDIVKAFRFTQQAEDALGLLRWPIILIVVSCFLANMYRFGPSREDPQWRWVTWGSGLASISWVLVSFAFSWYVRSFGSFDRTYGSIGAVVAFMFWIWLSTLVALIGAQLNSEMEHQTAADTTTGQPLPLGLRGATQADTVA